MDRTMATGLEKSGPRRRKRPHVEDERANPRKTDNRVSRPRRGFKKGHFLEAGKSSIRLWRGKESETSRGATRK